MSTILTSIGVALGLAAPAVAAYTQIMGVLRPLLRRRALRVIICPRESETARAISFAEQLRRDGYRSVTTTWSEVAMAGAQCVVVWLPEPETAAKLVATVQRVAPEAMVVIYTHERLHDVTFGERQMLVQSAVRLRSDLAAIAEMGVAR